MVPQPCRFPFCFSKQCGDEDFHIESEKISLPKRCTLVKEVEQPNCHVTAEREAVVLEGGVWMPIYSQSVGRLPFH